MRSTILAAFACSLALSVGCHKDDQVGGPGPGNNNNNNNNNNGNALKFSGVYKLTTNIDLILFQAIRGSPRRGRRL